MWFVSTSNPSTRIDCRTAILSAYAPDGGLLLPGEIPKIDSSELKRLAKLSYVSLLADLLSRFLAEFSVAELELILSDLPDMFSSKNEVIPIRRISLSPVLKLSVAELFHGPSLAFKDLATIPACRLMDACLGDGKSPHKKGLVVVSTSGDTGASVAGAVTGAHRLSALILLPAAGRVAKVQELQTTTWPSENVHIFSGDASSDDLDILAARMQEGSPLCDQNLLETAKRRGILLTSLNSLNPIRILAQLTPFFYSYLKICPNADKKVCFVLPTGGGGNLVAGLLARRMNLPIELVVALNANASITHVIEYFTTKEALYDVPPSVRTLAPAMDMGFPYNFPRIVHLTTDGTGDIKISANPITGKQQVEMGVETLKNVRSSLFGAESATDSEIVQMMRLVASENGGYTICPHTATAIFAARKLFSDENATKMNEFCGVVVMATASPAKFVEALERADLLERNNELLEKLRSLPIRSIFLKKTDKTYDSIPYDEWFAFIKKHVENVIFPTLI